MPKISGLAQAFFLAGYNLSGDVGSISKLSTPVATMKTTAISDTVETRIQTLVDSMIEWKTYMNNAAGQEHAALKALPTTDLLMLYCLGTAVGAAALWLPPTRLLDYPWDRQANGDLMGTVSLKQNSPGTVFPEWGVLLSTAPETHASAASDSYVDTGQENASGIAAIQHIVSIGSGTPTIIIEHSSDHIGWATLLSFTAVPAANAPTAERKTATGTVHRYLRVTSTGTFTACVFAVAYRLGTAFDRIAY